MGRGGVTFSISSAMAFASYTPTQMGRTVSLAMSLRITMGMLVTGSIMSPRIFISTSIGTPGNCQLPAATQNRSSVIGMGQLHGSLYHHFPQQTVGKTRSNLYHDITPQSRSGPGWSCEVQDLVL